MTTVAEIESAIEQLPIEQVREVPAWLEEYQATINASTEVLARLDAEEGIVGSAARLWQSNVEL
jgi:hypothetical protein